MRARKLARGWLLAVVIASMGAGGPLAVWAQDQAATPTDSPDDWGRTVLADVASAIGTLIYAPVKGLILCPAVGLVAGGATYIATQGKTDTPKDLLRLGCTGSYVVTPSMIRGQESFRTNDTP